MEDMRPKVLDFIKLNGPSLPVQIAKKIDGNIILAGAVLSELIHNKKLKISIAKIGGSPVYYLPGQESRLEILYQHLNEKERKAYALLKENKILRDKELEPWQRIALRDLRDFAVMLQVSSNGFQEIFWRWHLITDQEAEPLIKEVLNPQQEFIQEPIEQKVEMPAKLEIPITNIEKPIPKLEEKREIIKETPRIKKKKSMESKQFDVRSYFNNKNIKILNENIIKPEKELEFIIKVPSSVGEVKFFAKVLDKAKINDKDLILAHSQSQLKRMPLLFLSNGELTKKGQEYLIKNHINFEKLN